MQPIEVTVPQVRTCGLAVGGAALVFVAGFFTQALVVPCGAPRNFYDPAAIPSDLRSMLEKDVIFPDGCNRCADSEKRPIWAAPGDLCTLQRDQLLEDYPDLTHCRTAAFATDYDPSHHLKSCVSSQEADALWQTDHCHVNGTGPGTGIAPFFDEMREGLLFCASETFYLCARCEKTTGASECNGCTVVSKNFKQSFPIAGCQLGTNACVCNDKRGTYTNGVCSCGNPDSVLLGPSFVTCSACSNGDCSNCALA